MTGDVLVLRALGLGDLLVVVPALRALRRHHPRHRIVLATPPVLEPLVRATGAVDVLLPTAAPGVLHWPWDAPPAVAVNLHGAGPQSHLALDATGPGRRIGFGGGQEWEGPGWADVDQHRPHERERWCALLQACGMPADPGDLRLAPPRPSRLPATTPAVVHPGAAYGAKCWPAERFAAVARGLDRAGHLVVVTGSAAERDLACAVAAAAGLPDGRVLAGRTDIAQLMRLVAVAAVVVCGDTGIAHLASALVTPSVVLFGPVSPRQWGPPASGPHAVLCHDGLRRGDPFAADPDPALLAVEVDEVLTAAAEVQSARRRQPARPAG